MERPRIVLTMIVKNEAHVIERCIRSIRPLIDSWCIVDTGSTDATREVIRAALADLPGDVYDVPWRDFAHNRSAALELARSHGEYSLMIDADVECVVDPTADLDELRRSLCADVYDVELRDSIYYSRPLLTSTRQPFTYRGVLHEFLVKPPEAVEGGAVTAFHYRSNYDGARSKNPTKFLDDAALLEHAITDNAEPDLTPRYTFYLAQSYRDAGEPAKAALTYEHRAGMGGWSEEIYVAWLWCGRLRSRIGSDVATVIDAFLRAGDAVPHRAEAYCEAATVARNAQRMPTAYAFAKIATALSQPTSGLFIEPAVYRWRSLYELSISAYYAGRLDEGLAASKQLLDGTSIPDAERAAVANNLRFYGA